MYYEFPVCVQLEFLYATSFKTGKNKYTAYATYTIYTAYSLYHIRTSSDFTPEKNPSISTKGREYFCRLIFIRKVTLSTVWLTVFAVIMIYLTKVVEDKFTFLI